MQLQGIASNEGSGLFGTYFLSYEQFPLRAFTLAIRTEGEPSAAISTVRAAIARIDPDLAFYDVRPMDALVTRALVDRRTPMLLAIGFAVVALVLCAIGIYGVLAYDVRQRTKEIAIRMTLGADRTGILILILREGAAVVAAGALLGVTGMFLLRRSFESQLYEVSPLDPVVASTVAAVLIVVAILASALPARHAASTHPNLALADQ
jgi:ABC-type antimicrobial peptide transport system permease subunit